MTDADPVLLAARAGDVAILTLNRPGRLNALDSALVAALNDAVERIADEGTARALLLRGAGRAFCSGADLQAGVASADAGAPLEQRYNPLLHRLAALPIPIVAAVQGPAAGAGCALALAADFVVAARSAYFLLAFVNIGLVPDAGATWIIPRLVGVARARAMMMLGERIPAEQAAAWGLIHEAAPDDEAAARAEALAARLAAGPTRALGLMRRTLARALEGSLDETLTDERWAQRDAGRTADFAEGKAAFLQRRPASFKGR